MNNHGKEIFDLDVIVDFIFDKGLFFISVKNISDYPVFKLSFEFNEKIIGLNGSKEISSLPLFRNIEFLAPKKEITTLLDTSYSYFKRKQPEKINVKISYKDKDGEIKKGNIKHDLSIYKEIGYLIIENEKQNNTGGEQ
ncbi:MAG TPA: hypothetical protein VMT35_11725 [Ignavibacteriaceae bacterium]|nr:hypothetical protein [Ignavibacteriaceae bacterium]